MTPSGLADRVRILREAWRVKLWPLPTLGVVLGVAVGVGLPRVDAAIDDQLPASLTVYLFGGGADAARTVLDSIAGSLITVTSLTFSLTVVTLQLASSQYSPRLLRTFSRDRVVHATLALFLSTFTYSLAVLRTVRTAADEQEVFVPQLSVTLAFALAVASVLALVGFLAHLTGEIRVETMLQKVHIDASKTVKALTVERDDRDADGLILPARPAGTVPVMARSSGFLVSVDEDALLAAAVDADAVVFVDRNPGESIVAGSPLGAAWPRHADSFDAERWGALSERTANAVSTGFERTAAQDIAFGLRQLTDVAIRALSPGINDPTTAVHALGHCSALLVELAGRDLRSRTLRDEDDEIRVVVRRPDFRQLLDEAVAQPRRYGASDPAVLARILALLDELAWCVRLPDHQGAIADQLVRLRATVAAQPFDATERVWLEGLAERVDQTMAGRQRPRHLHLEQ